MIEIQASHGFTRRACKIVYSMLVFNVCRVVVDALSNQCFRNLTPEGAATLEAASRNHY